MAFDFKTFGESEETKPEMADLQSPLLNKQEKDSKLPLLTKPEGGFGTSIRDVGVGVGKELIESSRGTAQLLQGTGKAILGAFGADTSKMGFKSLEDKSVDEILKAKSRGEQVGKVLGFGAELGSGFVKATPTIKGAIETRKGMKAIKAVTPEVKSLPGEMYKKAISQGRITPTGILKSEQYILPEAQKQTAIKYRNLITSKDPIKNSNNLFKEIARQDTEVGNFLKKNNSIYNSGELKNFLLENLKDIDDITIPAERIGAYKETLVNGFIRNLPKNDMSSLWKARKAFDSSIEKVFKQSSPTFRKTMQRAFRDSIQDFIGSKTPDKFYQSAIKEMSNIYRLTDNLAMQAAREKGMSKLRLLLKRHPVATKIMGGIIGYQAAQALGVVPE